MIGDVLVTGGAGAIGSRLVRLLLEQDYERIVVLDDLSSGYAWLLPVDRRVSLIERCVYEDDAFQEVDLDRPVVFHLAAQFANQNSVEHPEGDLMTNGYGTLLALLWAIDTGATRFVYAGAGCSMGPDGPHTDTPYQITKALGELYCRHYADRIPITMCRFHNSYGPGELPGTYRNVIPNFIWRALHDAPLVITGTGDETRDFIYVDDLVETMATAPPGLIEIGSASELRIEALARLVIEACESSSTIEYAPRRSWDRTPHRVASSSSARGTMIDGLARTVAWFRENRERIAREVGAP